MLPALTVGAGLIVTIIKSVADKQFPIGSFVVSVNVTLPVKISFDDGMYVAAINDESSNVPVPEVVQVIELAPPPNVPDNVTVLLEQIVASLPALTTETGFMVNSNVSIACVHIPDGSFVVRINETEPAIISFADGV